jgi:hypothetical protein
VGCLEENMCSLIAKKESSSVSPRPFSFLSGRARGHVKVTRQTFSEVELTYDKIGKELSKMLLLKVLVDYDEELFQNRKNLSRDFIFHPVKKVRNTIKTKFGVVEYVRRYYKYKNIKTDEQGTCYLLDEAMNITTIGKFSLNVALNIAELIAEESYREVAQTITQATGDYVSAPAVHAIVQKIGKKFDREEKYNARLSNNCLAIGKREVPFLYEERDGVHINMQGKDRPKNGNKVEMKLACAYEGFQLGYMNKKTGEQRFERVGKKVIAGFESSREFLEKKEGYIATDIDISKIQNRVINADGAAWCKADINDIPGTYFQLDPFHIGQAITRAILTDGEREKIRELHYAHHVDDLLIYTHNIYSAAVLSDKMKKADSVEKLYSYLNENRDGLIPYTKNKEYFDSLPPLRDGLVHRNLGTMESTVENIACLRLKHRKASWSKVGAVNVTRLICYKRTTGLSEKILGLDKMSIPETFVKSATNKAKKIKKKIEAVPFGALPETIGNIPELLEIPASDRLTRLTRTAYGDD